MDVFNSLTPLAASRLRASVVSPLVQPYCDHLCNLGYAHSTLRLYLNCLAHFAHWATQQRTELADIDQQVKYFLHQHLPHCHCDAPVQRTRQSVRSALAHLTSVAVAAGVRLEVKPLSQTDEQLLRFERYMLQLRGLATGTLRRRLSIVRPLASMTDGVGLPTPDQLRLFLREELSRVSPASAGVTTTAVRSYLRFRAFEGARVDGLLPIVASPASWRLAPLPQTLTPSEVQRLLEAFPTGLPSRLRSYAIVRCLVDLGLRSSEAIALELDNIDWSAGTLRVCKAKSRRVDILPLPQATGAAIAEYLRLERPQTSSRRIFVRHLAPVEVTVSAGVARRAVREAYQRAGLPHTRVHILRHTLAARLLNSGSTLKEVADVLRHRELDTSLIYAKVDFKRLGAVAMPWPGNQS